MRRRCAGRPPRKKKRGQELNAKQKLELAKSVLTTRAIMYGFDLLQRTGFFDRLSKALSEPLVVRSKQSELN